MARCPRCRALLEDQWAIYCDNCWDQIEEDYREGYTAGQGDSPEPPETDMSDLQEDD